MTSLRGKVVVVTGAASGIGRELAVELVARGATVAISDVNERELAETANLVRHKGSVSTRVVDVSKREQWAQYAEAVERAHGPAHVVINNAGVAVRAPIETISYEDFELVIDINFWGVVYGSKTFIPQFRKNGSGHIVNVSSLNAMVPFANQAPYNCSKYAVLGFSETLMQELRGQPIKVSVVHPGGIRTNLVRNASTRGLGEGDAKAFDRIARTSARSAAMQILDGVERDRERIYVGLDAKLIATGKRIAPGLTVNLAGRATSRLGRRLKKK
ncbi:MAG TPA: SDR family oxidoreductase [Polyangiales bacterium]|nr:SDR family oxidoreductase [Polyangiales bacterium]